MRIIGLIPARGGSRGIPGKNLMQVGGRSLVERAIQCGKIAQHIDVCVVSSDDDSILDEAERCGALAVRRPRDLAMDATPSLEVIRDFISSRSAEEADGLVLLQPTSPFRSAADIDRCTELLIEGESATTVCENEHPIEWVFGLDASGRLQIPESGVVPRRQDAPAHFRLAGSVYATPMDRLRSGEPLVNSETIGVVVPRHRAIDIDDPFDLDVARALAGTRYDPFT